MIVVTPLVASVVSRLAKFVLILFTFTYYNIHNIIIVSTTITEFIPTPAIIKLQSLLFYILYDVGCRYTLIFISFE